MSNLKNNNAQLEALIEQVNALPVAITVDATLTQEGAAADAKATGDRLTALSEEIAKLPQGGGAAIVDVTELPETDIREDVFYRVLTAEYWYNGTPSTIYTCHVVETLPAVGEPATDATLSAIVSYYAADTGENSGYLTAELGAALGGLPAGWYPAAALFQAVGVAYGGIVGSLDEMQSADALYIYLQETLKYRNNDAWDNVQSIGWRGTGNAAEVFNTPLNVASGITSHAEGYNTTASGGNSHAEGTNTTASGITSHAEGYNTTASGSTSHAEGTNTTASGSTSHAEGYNTTASGEDSHAEGVETISSRRGQHVQGRYNVEDTSEPDFHRYGKYAHIVGNGESVNDRSNAHTLDWKGNAWYQGTVESAGMLLTSPNGTKYKITIADDGTLTATVVTE